MVYPEINNVELIKALKDYWNPTGPLYRKAFHRIYIEENFKHEDVIKVEAYIKRKLNRAKLLTKNKIYASSKTGDIIFKNCTSNSNSRDIGYTIFEQIKTNYKKRNR